jgi:cytochrome c553
MRIAPKPAALFSVCLAVVAVGAALAQAPSQPSAAPPVHYNQDYLKLPAPAHPVPFWAFTRDPPATADFKRRADDDVLRHIAGSTAAFTRAQVLNHYDVVDWHPGDHPPAPEIVMYGHKPQPTACGFCHLPNGAGLPENAPLAGLPTAYFVQQVHDFQNKSRRSADMRMASYHGMADVIAPKISAADLKAAADYYASLKLAPYIKVVETKTVPRMQSVAYTLLPAPGGGREPIGTRIIETPKDVARYQLLDSEVGYIAYVPVGSIEKGRALVTTGGNGKTLPCGSCHGADLKGVGDIPPLAGRGPSNLVRQLYDIKFGARSAPDAQRMGPVVKNLKDEDIVDIVAYIASLKP